MVPLIKPNWKIQDKLAWFSLVISSIALIVSFTVSVVGYRSQARYNELQNRVLLIEHAPNIEWRNLSFKRWLGDTSEYVTLILKNTGNVPACEFSLSTRINHDDVQFSPSAQGVIFRNNSVIVGGQETEMPLIPLEALKREFDIRFPEYRFICLVDDGNFLAPDVVRQNLAGVGIDEPAANVMVEHVLMPILINLHYKSALGHQSTLHINLYVLSEVIGH